MNQSIVKNQKGFSLVELMVSVAIMSTLAFFGVMTTTDVINTAKKETAKAKVTNDIKMELSKYLKDPAFSSSQKDIAGCMAKTTGRENCYKNSNVYVPGKMSKVVAGNNTKPLYLNKEGGDVKGTCDSKNPQCTIKIVNSVKEFCDWDSARNSMSCPVGKPAQYAQVDVVFEYRDHKDSKFEKVFKLSTIISNEANAMDLTYSADGGACKKTYTYGLTGDLEEVCEDTSLLTDMKTPILIGPKGFRGPQGPPGPPCGGGAIAFAPPGHLNGPAKILKDVGKGKVKVINQVGEVATIKKTKIPEWSARGGGCFEEGTRIQLTNGDFKKIENIEVGDKIWNPFTHKVSYIHKRVKGPEKHDLYKFGAGNKILSVTKTHPMVTMNGIKKAEELTKDDLILLDTGEFQSISFIEKVPTSKNVYNLHLVDEFGNDIEGGLVANGFVTGDLDMQLKLEKGTPEFNISNGAYTVSD